VDIAALCRISDGHVQTSRISSEALFVGKRWSSASSNMRRLALTALTGLVEIIGLSAIAVCLGAGAALYMKKSRFWTTEAIAAIEDKPQVVNRSRKQDRLAMIVDSSPRSAGPQDGFGMLEVGGPLNTTITIRDSNGWLVFELDPLRRTTVVAKREGRRVPSSKEPGPHMAPKSRVVPIGRPSDCDPPSCRAASVTPLAASLRFPS
jgi:hypothetical protein